jgi:hypothetical protein
MACPAACHGYDMDIVGDEMQKAITRMRINGKCWNSDTVPDEGYTTRN